MASLSEVWVLHDTLPELPFTETVVAPLRLLEEAESSLAY